MAEPSPDSISETKAEAPPGPLILFDGVCNLCNAAVQWVIARDRRNRFRFASLQSQAGRSALAAAGPAADASVPSAGRLDSVVLLDEEGVHVRSEAALRIARALGFPWSLARIGSVLPRPLRDAVYDWIARHRYRWFGRQNACMIPTPELRARFLDADEPPVAAGAPAESADPAPTLGPVRRSLPAVLRAWCYRFVLVYLFLNVFPFPLGTIPFTDTVAAKWTEGSQWFGTWVAKAVFGLTIEFYPLGSGDTTYNYVEVATHLTLALVAAALWTLARRGRPVSERTRDGMRTYVRLFLAVVLLGYGWSKVMPLQMPAPGPDRLLVPIGDTSPMGLLWTFMGASSAYQIFAGLGEVVAGLLLFWRRTALLGALIGAGVLANVVALNFCYDVPVKLFSSHLLLMSLFLIAPHAARLVAILVLNLPAQPVPLQPFPLRRTWLRRAAAVVYALFFVWVAIVPVYFSYQMLKTLGLLAPPAPLQGTYRVESFARGGVLDRANADAVRWVRVGLARYAGTIQRADGRAVRMRLELDKAKGTLTLTSRDDPKHPIPFRYSEPGPGLLRLEGRFEGGETVALLRRQTEGSSLLMTRGFHWINEVPLNR